MLISEVKEQKKVTLYNYRKQTHFPSTHAHRYILVNCMGYPYNPNDRMSGMMRNTDTR